MKRLRALGRKCGHFAKSLVWDTNTGTVSSGRVNLFVTLTIATYIVHKIISWVDHQIATKGELPAGALEVVAGIATVLFGGGVGGYMMNRFASRASETMILPTEQPSPKTEDAEQY